MKKNKTNKTNKKVEIIIEVEKDKKLLLIRGDITKERVDAIVNAANSQLAGGGGVDGAIHKAAGEQIHKECQEIIKKIKRLDTGKAVATSAGKLPIKYIIHTVGPIWQGGSRNEDAFLESAYKESLQLAEKLNLSVIAFPSISTGTYGYPVDEASKIAIKTVVYFLKSSNVIKEVRFILFDEKTFDAYETSLSKIYQ